MKTRIVILCAGKGKRMGASIPKPLIEVHGQPMVLRLLSAVKESGIDESPILVVSPDGKNYFEQACKEMHCEYAVQAEQLGTGHAVASAQEIARDAEQIIVLYGDHPFITKDILKQLVILKENNSQYPLVMLTTIVPNYNGDYAQFLHWGRIIRDHEEHIIATREYKDATEAERAMKEVNPGIYLFDARWLWKHLGNIQNKNTSGEYYLTDLVEIAIEAQDHIASDCIKNPFEVMGINSQEELARAEQIMETPRPAKGGTPL